MAEWLTYSYLLADAEQTLGSAPTYVMCGYIALLLGLGVYGFLKSKLTDDDYYLAGRGQSFLITALTIMATFFSSAALLGIPGAIYKDGIAFFFSRSICRSPVRPSTCWEAESLVLAEQKAMLPPLI